MGRKLISALVVAMVSFVTVFAQSSASMQEINEIKKQGETYLFAESTSETWADALDNAKYLLGIEIETWVKSNGQTEAEGYVAKAKNHIFEIKSMRGDRFRAFVYVAKTEIMPYSEADQLVVVPMNGDKETTIELVSSSKSPESPETPQPTTYQPTAFEQEMMSITNANNIGTYIKRLQSEGKIKAFGKYKDMPANADCYLYVYNREMAIPAYLKKQGQTYTNLRTGQADNVTNYKGCGAYWFQIK